MHADPDLDHPGRIRIVAPSYVITLTNWMHSAPGELTVQEADLLSEAKHFGRTPVWGLVDDPDPVGCLWSPLVPRPVIPGFLAVHVGEC